VGSRDSVADADDGFVGRRLDSPVLPPAAAQGSTQRPGVERIKGLDIRGHGGFIVVPPSMHPKTGNRYRWLGEVLPPVKLPRFVPAWVYRRKRRPATPAIVADCQEQLHRRVAAYVATIEPAVSGQGGHNKTFYAACKIADLVQRDPALTWHFLQVYNGRCQPPWSEAELRHKWHDALNRRPCG